MATLPEDMSVAIDELGSAITEMESHLESVRAERDEAKARQVELEIENANLRRELNLAREQQKASAGILSVISSSVADTKPVFESILSSIKHLFDSEESLIFLTSEEGLLQIAAARGANAEAARERFPIPIEGTASELAIRERRLVRSADVQNDPDVPIDLRETARRIGQNYSMAIAPMLWEDKAIGTVFVGRTSMVPFTDRECELLNSFADQAVIAIQNARLFDETREALERQTATADILKVIASSPSEVQPVLDVIVNSAAELFAPHTAVITTLQDGKLHWRAIAASGPSFDHEKAKSIYPIPFDPDRSPSCRAIMERRIIEIPDIEAPGTPELTRRVAAAGGFRSATFVPLIHRGEGIGTINLTTPQAGFRLSEKQLTLVRTFADQAVIAIENTRLFNETREALERQTATAEILKVIASSPSDVQPVFEAIASSAKTLLGAFSTTVLRFIGDELHLVAYTPTDPKADEALQSSFPRPLAEFPTFALVRNGETIQFPDTEADDVPQANKELGRLRGFRSVLFIPLMNQGTPVGIISVTRAEPGAFAPHHVQLLQTFADQAVIAIENTRLFNETQEALERQTATAEILKVIASSPSDVQPVFDAIAHSANRLIGGFSAAVFRYSDGRIHLAAFTPTDAQGDAVLQSAFPVPLDQFPPYQLTRKGAPAELPDTELEPAARDIARARGYRSMLFAPLINDGEAVGIITVTRVAPGPFGEQHTRLLQMFADQAVIAIKNVGLFNEVQQRTNDLSESLRQQTAVGDVLKTISRSTFDLQPVLDTLVNSAAQLCDADMAFIMRRVGDEYRAGAAVGYTEAYIDFLTNHPLPVNRGTVTGRAVLERRPVQIADVVADPEYTLHETTTLAGQRTTLGVPLLRENEPIGVIVLARQRVEPFTQKQIDLVATFADQTVIAIENVRLFNEVQRRTSDLSEALTYQTGSANILKVIASSPTDVGPVLDAIVESACELCDANDAIVYLKEDDHLSYKAHHGPIPVIFGEKRAINRDYVAGRSVVDKMPIHVSDVFSEDGAEFPEAQELSRSEGIRSILSAPLLRESESIGAILLRRTEVHPFTDKQINLLQTFADQAVIAIGNVQLFEEVQARTRDLTESLQQQTATADVLRVISASPGELEPVFQAMLENAVRLCEAKFAMLRLLDGDQFRAVGTWNLPPAYSEFLARNPIRIDPKLPLGRVVNTKQPVHVHDVLQHEAYLERYPGMIALAEIGGARTLLQVPMLKEGHLVGSIGIYRQEVRPFTDKQIALVQNFASQAVIAIENARLLNELRQRTNDLTESLEQQTATSEVLRVISSSSGDLQPVFKSMLSNALKICAAQFGNLLLFDGNGFTAAELHTAPPAYADFFKRGPLVPEPTTALGRIVTTKQVVHIPDILAEGGGVQQSPLRIATAQILRARTLLAVPMLKESELVGTIVIYREEVRPFSQKQIDLVTNFANQAVIAIENARLLNQLRERTTELSQSLDNLRTAQDRLIQTEKLASLGQLTAGIAHEIKNPLNFVNNFSSLSSELIDELNDALKAAALDTTTREEIDEVTQTLKSNLERVVQHGKRADSIVKNMLLHSREGGGEHRLSDINALIDESLNLAYHGARAEKPGFNVTLERDFDPAAGQIDVFPQEITRVFLNLVSNGFHAVTKRNKEGGEPGFEPRLRASTKNLGESVEIRIRDNGTGIPPEVKEKMFNPFFTTKPAGEGTGLGLSMSHDIIVKQHGGTIDVDTEQGHFTEFRIVLPRTSNFAEKSRG